MYRYLALTLSFLCTASALAQSADPQQIDQFRRQEAERRIEREAAIRRAEKDRIQCWNGKLVSHTWDCPPTPAQNAAWEMASRENNKRYERMMLQQKCTQSQNLPGIDFETRSAAEGLAPWALAKVAIAAHKAGRPDVAEACLTIALPRSTTDALAMSMVGDGYRTMENHTDAILIYRRSLELIGIEVNCVAATRTGGQLLASRGDLARSHAEVEAAREHLRALRLGIGGRGTSGDKLAAEARLTRATNELAALACRYSPAEVAGMQAESGQLNRYNRLADYRASLGIAESLLALGQVEDAREWALRSRALESKISERPNSRSP